jgi:hypothetical protein
MSTNLETKITVYKQENNYYIGDGTSNTGKFYQLDGFQTTSTGTNGSGWEYVSDSDEKKNIQKKIYEISDQRGEDDEEEEEDEELHNGYDEDDPSGSLNGERLEEEDEDPQNGSDEERSVTGPATESGEGSATGPAQWGGGQINNNFNVKTDNFLRSLFKKIIK